MADLPKKEIRAINGDCEHELRSKILDNPDFFRTIVEQSADCIMILDSALSIQYLNRPAEQLFGRKATEMIGLPFGLISSAREKDEIGIVRPDGKQVYAEIRSVGINLFGFNGEIVTIRDVSIRKQKEEALFLMRKFESISILSGGLCHDFNNLLSVIIGYIELSAQEAVPGSLQQNNLTEAHSAAMEARLLTQRLLQLADMMKPELRCSAINGLLKQITQDLSETFGKDHDLDCPADIWPVLIDRIMIQKAVRNVVMNAYEATKNSGKICVQAENVTIGKATQVQNFIVKKGAYVKVSIRDKGCGIPQEKLTMVFDPYYTTKSRGVTRGVGLGLATAYSIIKNHGGYIYMESEMDRGSRVSIFIPAVMPGESVDGHR